MSGFFFCGMIELPVDHASCRVTYPNSVVLQMITSSASRDRSTAIMASTKAASAAKSREAVASIELSAAAANPSSSAIASGSRPSDEPASAPEPYGETAVRRSKSTMRSTSRSSGWAWASRWWANSTGCAACRWVLPGMIAVG